MSTVFYAHVRVGRFATNSTKTTIPVGQNITIDWNTESRLLVFAITFMHVVEGHKQRLGHTYSVPGTH